jgi:hypothetical protein
MIAGIDGSVQPQVACQQEAAVGRGDTLGGARLPALTLTPARGRASIAGSGCQAEETAEPRSIAPIAL